MIKFLHLNMPEFNELDQDITRSISLKNVCISCRKEDGAFILLCTCKHASIFELFYNYKVDYQNLIICHQCHNFLKKIELFKLQIEESLNVLNKQTQSLKLSKKSFRDLQCTKTEVYTHSQQNEQNYCKEDSVKDESSEANSPRDHYNDIATEIKVEHDSYSEFDNDLPLSQLKKEIKTKKKKKKKVKSVTKEVNIKSQKRTSLYKKYEGKIAVIYLSRQEMLLERDRDAVKASYLKLPYKCDSCITGFDHELTLQDHMEKRHGPTKEGHICDICKSVLSTETSYKEHTKRHTRRYECQACGKRNNNVYSVIKHYNQEHGTISTQYECRDCKFTTDSHRSFRYHRDKHKQKQRCSLCDSTFVNNAGLRVHMFTVHKQSTRIYSCEECNKIYNAKSGLVSHIASAHGGNRLAYCAPCKKHFRTKHNLTHHLRTHSAHVSDNDKRFICDECGVKFLTKGSLQEHIDFVHLKSSKHECTKCQKVFKNGSALKKHENFVHKKIRPPRNKICDHCGRGFTTLAILQCHVRTHTGERPLRCVHCFASFAHSAALYTHNKLLHSKDRRKP